MSRYLGRPIPRVEDLRFLTGCGRYTDDIQVEGQAHCAFVRSVHAPARILRSGRAAAARASGVIAILTGADYLADGCGGIEHQANPADALDLSERAFVAPAGERIVELPHWPLAIGRARHVGEAVAL